MTNAGSSPRLATDSRQHGCRCEMQGSWENKGLGDFPRTLALLILLRPASAHPRTFLNESKPHYMLARQLRRQLERENDNVSTHSIAQLWTLRSRIGKKIIDRAIELELERRADIPTVAGGAIYHGGTAFLDDGQTLVPANRSSATISPRTSTMRSRRSGTGLWTRRSSNNSTASGSPTTSKNLVVEGA